MMLAREISERADPAFDVDWVDTYNEQGNDRIIVIGSGPVGMRFVETMLTRLPHSQIALFGNEPHEPYNRVQLSSLLAGDIKRDDIDLPLPNADDHPFFRFYAAHICEIDREAKTVKDTLGRSYDYDILVLATGARAHIPNIPGNDQQGVYVFRSLADTESLYARITRSRRVIVAGGGLLGIEAAKALSRSGTEVSIIQQGPHLMNRQLDEKAASMLEREVNDLGIEVIANDSVREIIGKGRVKGIRTRNGQFHSCDTVVLCAGIRANNELALSVRLKINTGIVVDDSLQTSDPDIFAIGECCEHKGQMYGLVNPGYEQAAIAADIICHGSSFYNGSASVSRLKVLGQSVCSMGDVVERTHHALESELVFDAGEDGIYRKVILHKGYVVGALGYGEWPESNRIQTAFQNKFYIWPWQRLRFQLSGNFWPSSETDDVTNWPDKSVVCQCKGVTKAEIKDIIARGCSDLPQVQAECGASTVCGSCKPLVQELLGAEQAQEKEKSWAALLVSAVIALVVTGMMLFMPEAQVSDSVQTVGWFESVWNDKFWKQVTGFTLLGLTLVGLLMSLRKRLSYEWLGEFAYWRLLHVVLGVLCALTLIFHTGFNSGSNLNQILLFDFLAILVLGASTSAVVSLSHSMSATSARKLRRFWTWMHIIVSWPIPALLIAHIVTVYYF